MTEEHKVEELKPKAAESDTPVYDTNQKPTVDASRRLRDEKGHFLPNPNSIGKRRPKKLSLKKELDENTVKIKIVKEEKPLPPKEFEGRLEDARERTAISFIRSIIAHRPRRIDFDGQKYFSEEILNRLSKAYNREVEKNVVAHNVIAKVKEAFSEVEIKFTECLKSSQNIEMAYDNLYIRKTIWKCLAIGLIIGTIAVNLLPAAYRFAQKKWFIGEAPIVEQTSTDTAQGK